MQTDITKPVSPVRRLKFTLYTEHDTQRELDEAYKNYCQSIEDSEKLVRPLSKSSWILSLVRRCIHQMQMEGVHNESTA
jgi:hypothetical protein